jgi:deazaflavin-dependent oxidoreductase (nitroreductase family)
VALEGEYEPSPWEPIAEQVAAYEATGGEEGGTLEGAPCIVLWTRGRRSGKVRKTPLMRITDGERYAVVASMGGAPDHPVWYHNLVAHPEEVALQDGPELRDYVAHQATGDEKAEWWARGTEVWPAYDDYQAATEREIPLFVLEPAR